MVEKVVMAHKYTALDIMGMRVDIEDSVKNRIKEDNVVILDKIVGVNKNGETNYSIWILQKMTTLLLGITWKTCYRHTLWQG